MPGYEIMTIEEVADYLRVSERTVYDWVQKGELPGGKLGTSWRFKRTDIDQWVSERLGKPKASETSPLDLKGILSQDRCLLLESESKAGALDELMDCMEHAAEIKKPAEFREAVHYREKLMSTGIGLGVAIPHVRLPSVTDIVVGAGVSRTGIQDYDALDGQPVHLIFMIAAGDRQHSEYLRILASISRRIREAAFRKQLFNLDSAEALYKALVREG